MSALRIAGIVLPGLAQLLRGRVLAGTMLLATWLTFLATAWIGRARIVLVPRTGSLDDWVALVTLALGLAGTWLLAQRLAVNAPDAAGQSQWRIALRSFRRNRLAVAGVFVIGAMYAATLLAPFLAPWDPAFQGDIARTGFLPPERAHWLGTDRLGRDILSRILYGARISLSIGFVATAISVTVGTALGAIAGYAGGRLDAAVMRLTDMVLSFPRLILLILVVALFEPSVLVIILVLGLTQWPGTTRIVRGEALSLREREFIQAARSLGFGPGRIIMRHIVPNLLAPVIVTATLGVGNTIVLEAGLSFLGLGPPPPLPTWGGMVAAGGETLIEAWWVATFPGLTIVLVVLAFNLVGDGLRDALDPRLRT